jgi:hypothetical protein
LFLPWETSNSQGLLDPNWGAFESPLCPEKGHPIKVLLVSLSIFLFLVCFFCFPFFACFPFSLVFWSSSSLLGLVELASIMLRLPITAGLVTETQYIG